MNLSDRDKQIIKDHIERGEPLPPKYKLMLFADAPEVELTWQGKSSEVTSVVLPFQSIEQIDEPRSEVDQQVGDLFSFDSASGRQLSGWTNKLIWGDNKLVLSSLKNGPLRREIEAAGGLKLIYIDPPYDMGQDFSFDVEVGEETLTKEPSVIEELAYRDTWGKGTDSYLSMMYERLYMMRDLLADDGSIFVHSDWRVSSHIKILLFELWGASNFCNEIAWRRSTPTGGKTKSKMFPRDYDSIMFFRKSEDNIFENMYLPYSKDYTDKFFYHVDESGRRYASQTLGDYSPESIAEFERQGKIITTKAGTKRLKQYLDESKGILADDIWTDIRNVRQEEVRNIAKESERLDYPTQKPEALLERIISACSRKGDLIADFFCGSGTTLAAAEKLGTKWIGCDLGRFAIHTTRKRLIGVQRELKAEGRPYRSFEILNLGACPSNCLSRD